MRRCSLSLVLAVSLLLTALPRVPAVAGYPGLVINEVLYDPDGPDTGFEFVEVLNCGRDGVSLAGWTLESGNGANPDDWTVEWVGGDFDYLGPGEFLLVGESNVVPEPDVITPLDLQNGPDGLRLTDGAEPIDVVGWGEPLFHEYYEGSPAPDVPSGHSVARSPDCYDHDDNSLDFRAAPVPTPGSGNSPDVNLSVTAVHSGNVVFPESGQAALECVVRNEGALDVAGGTSRVELLLDGSPDPYMVREIDVSLSPRDTVALALVGPSSFGYHRALIRVTCPGDDEPDDDVDSTSYAVGAPGGVMKLMELMYSPEEGLTEWVEFLNATSESVSLVGWLLGDDEGQYPVLPSGGGASVAPGALAVVAKDTASLGASSGCRPLSTRGWEALSADDVVVLLDEFGTPIERVSYEDSWGGGRGVSLERVREDVGAQEPCNWGSSVAAAGSTPCGVNSIRLPGSPRAGRLSVAPNPFTPDGDGNSDRTIISYDLPVARATVRISVYDTLGRRRATLVDHAASSSRGEVLWGGSDTAGRVLPSGLYVVRLEAINAREGVFVDEKRAVGLVR